MKRRDFLKLSGAASVAVAAAPLASLLPAKRYVLAFDGQTVFPVYGMSGGLTSKGVCYEVISPRSKNPLIIPHWADKFSEVAGVGWMKDAVPIEWHTLKGERRDLGLPQN